MNETNKPLNTSSAARKSRKLLNGVSCMCVRVVFSISFVDLHLNASHILPSSVYANRYLHNVAPASAAVTSDAIAMKAFELSASMFAIVNSHLNQVQI